MPKQSLYRCRHCGFETVKKTDNWEHIRLHIKPEKLLTCHKCPFVTEYKHHLEYHQRNHDGDKPFKCDKCDYHCVNKSMLKSHEKSHSSYYPYQCGDCTYVSKYIHSLKMHLKKYNHQQTPLMIDVYCKKNAGSNSNSNSNSNSISPVSDPIQDQPCILDLRVNSKLVH